MLGGSDKPIATAAEGLKTAEALTFPVILKAAHGGRARHARSPTSKDFGDAFETARRESLSAFGSDEIFVEVCLTHTRHIEVQLLGDRHGNLAHLWEHGFVQCSSGTEGN